MFKRHASDDTEMGDGPKASRSQFEPDTSSSNLKRLRRCIVEGMFLSANPSLILKRRNFSSGDDAKSQDPVGKYDGTQMKGFESHNQSTTLCPSLCPDDEISSDANRIVD